MRFYLNAPLVIGYALMATIACLGVFQFAAARGGYTGLALFTADQKRGQWLGLGMTVGALLAYVAFAPEILTPGPAGTEVAIMFAACALLALLITLAGADYRLKRAKSAIHTTEGGELVSVGDLVGALFQPPSVDGADTPPGALVVLPDPADLVAAPRELIGALRAADLAVFVLDTRATGDKLTPPLLLGHISTAVSQMAVRDDIDPTRVGLIGFGLGGDAAWQTAHADPQIKAALIIAPMGALADADSAPPGLPWLRELSYRQIWRWRQRRARLRQTAASLRTPLADGTVVPVTLAWPSDDAPILTMRIPEPELRRLELPGTRLFAPLDNDDAIRQVVAWATENLSHSETD